MARRRRYERLAGVGIAALGAVVVVVAGLALEHPQGQDAAAAAINSAAASAPAPSSTAAAPARSRPKPHRSAARTTRTSSPTAKPSPTVTATKMPLIVLNNTTISGLAQQASTSFQARGWTVTEVGNLQNSILSTCAYYDPSVPGAEASAHLLRRQFPAIKRVRPKFPELPAGPVVVVLTPDYVSG